MKSNKAKNALTKNDFKILLSIDIGEIKGGVIPEGTEDSVKRLVKAGLMGDDNYITVEGIEKAEQLRGVLQRLRAGIPYTDRKRTNPKAAIEKVEMWHTGSVDHKSITMTMEGGFIFIGPPVKEMKRKKASKKHKAVLPGLITAIIDGTNDYMEAKPIVFQTDGEIDGLELVWLLGDKNKVAVQSMYYDFVVDRWPGCKFLLSGKFVAVKVVLKGKGITKDSIVALIMPFLPDVNMPEIKVGNE